MCLIHSLPEVPAGLSPTYLPSAVTYAKTSLLLTSLPCITSHSLLVLAGMTSLINHLPLNPSRTTFRGPQTSARALERNREKWLLFFQNDFYKQCAPMVHFRVYLQLITFLYRNVMGQFRQEVLPLTEDQSEMKVKPL